ncbi:hypothetical protein MP631_18525 [Xanthomonas phaseoli pv. phaseoli]|nr:hypothetical protein MP631_18525 [Xanthomonas phaseoli pv. phaseoli]
MEPRAIASFVSTVALGVLLIPSSQALAQKAADKEFDPHRAYLQQSHVRDLSAARKQQLGAKLNAATVRLSAPIMAVLRKHGYTGVRAYISPQDDMLILDVAGRTIRAGDSLALEAEQALDALAQALFTEFDGEIYIAGYLTKFNGVSKEAAYPDESLGPRISAPKRAAADEQKIVVVSAGHGYRKL